MKLIEKLKFAPSLPTRKENPVANFSIYDIKINGINGEAIPLSDFRGKHMLLVNVASKCGFTKQYRALQELSDSYKDQLVVLGSPCNQFGGQEPGTASEITNFCEVNFGVRFLLTEKLDVKGNHQHPLYQWLTSKEKNGKMNSTVKWNFQKYLIDPAGNLVDVFYSITDPLSRKITRYLK